MTAGGTRHGAEIRKVLWITLGLNLAVAVAKIAAGAATSTLSVLADGYHSLLDGSGNIVGLVAIRFAHKPPDDDHHYGHRKFEVLASMVISLVLFATAFEIVASALSRLRGEGTPDPRPVTFVTLLVTLAVNVFVTTYESRRGRELGSPFLVADARHTLSDVLASCGVLIAIVCVRAGIPWADPAAAVVIGVVIVLAGYRILVSGLDVIADRSVLDAARIQAAVLESPGVTSCGRIRTRGF
ncbi:MAG: cation transporter, partial [Acidobacteria bacterium]|nr:cation transporter [Acidobacteriota bacterium]